MKRIIALVLVALTAMAVLAGCGADKGKDEGKNIDLNAVMQSVNSAAGVTATKIETPEDLKRYYKKIDLADVKSFAAQKDKDNDIVLVEATDTDAAGRVAAALDKKLQDIIRDSTSYSPEKAEIVKKCDVTVDGKYVSLIITDKADEAVKAYKEAIK